MKPTRGKTEKYAMVSRRLSLIERCRIFFLQRDRFNPPDFFGGECELFGLQVFFHMMLARGSGQREHPDLHGKPKDDLYGTST